MPGNNCCKRHFRTIIKSLLEDQDDDFNSFLILAIDNPLMKQKSNCPSIDFQGSGSDTAWLIDYRLEGTVTVDNVIDKTERKYDESSGTYYGGDLVGDFTFSLILIDHHHNELIKGAKVSWSGRLRDYARRPLEDEPTINFITLMVEREFSNLGQILLDYEKMPVSGEINPKKDEVELKETIDVTIENLADYNGQPPQWFQRILIKADPADYGTIVGGIPAGDYKVFSVYDPSIKFQFIAPDNCDKGDSVTFTLFNSCDIDDKTVPLPSTSPHSLITTKKIKLKCNRGVLDIHYKFISDSGKVIGKPGFSFQEYSYVGTIPFKTNTQVNPPTVHGSGKITLKISGTYAYGECTYTGEDGVSEVTLDGMIQQNPTGGPILNFNLSEKWIKEPHGQFICPRLETVFPAPYSAKPMGILGSLSLPFEDGSTKEMPFTNPTGLEGHYQWILHLKK